MQGHSLTEQILTHWKCTNAFQRSIQSRSAKLPFTFFDGPPFTSGDPHYGHLLQSIIKDMVPRRMAMRGYRVNRRRGRDCHGIPAENFVNKKLGITSKKQVEEEFGLKNYIEECRSMVNDVNDKRGRFVDHVGRWVDMENAYFTMHNEYMESVIHLFSDLYHNSLIYKGFKVLGYSRALGTPLSNHEINEGYQMRQDPAVTVKLTLTHITDNKKTQNQYAYTEDGYLETVMGIIKKDDKFLMMYDIKTGTWRVPGGKVDAGEKFEDAITREINEEVGISVSSAKRLGAIKIPHGGKLIRLNYYGIEYTGELKNMEVDKCGGLAWVSRIEADTELGYAVRIEPLGEESSIIDNQERIQAEFQDFDLVSNEAYTAPGADTAPISLLAWTTTPWTLPSNMFAAVNQENTYAMVYDLDKKEYFIVAAALVSKYYKNGDEYVFMYRLKGKNFLGINYKPLFNYYYESNSINPTYHKQIHRIVHGDFVTTESGTGIAHQAPAYGEDDYNLIATHLPKELAKDWLFDPVDQHGDFTSEVGEFAGINVIEANKPIIQKLKELGKLIRVETIDHSYPHCPRTKTPLIYKAIESRFVKEDQLKKQTVPSAEKLHFVPDAVKKRFTNGLAAAPDRNISRSRFWGCPLPVWENPEDPEERIVVGSIQEIYEYNRTKGQIEKKGDEYFYSNTGKLVDLHRPYIDDIILVNPETGNELHRIPEVLDCWFESGSMPYGQVHWMKNSSSSQSVEGQSYPTADFIAEGLDQTRGWFRALHVLGNAYLNQSVFQNVVVTGMILAEDGKKMSKSLQNYPDPSGLINQYGADSLRLYFLSSPVVRGEPLRFNEQGVEQMLKDFVIPLQNVRKFLKTYAEVDNRSHTGTEIYFMRHAEANGQHETASLTPVGCYQLEDKQLIENVVRVNPDIIICSPRERAYQTGLGVQKILQDYGEKDVELITSDLVLHHKMTEDTVGDVRSTIQQQYAGKKVLIVSHQGRFRVLWQYIHAIKEDIVHNTEFSKPYHLNNTQIVKIPVYKNTNELDHRIKSELHQMMKELNNLLDGYELEPATKILVSFVEKLTNRYVRRSRRRFWANGMQEDKIAAYNTLREVLEAFLKCAAPFAPFITEKIWGEMQKMKNSCHDDRNSIHLAHWPMQSDLYINTQLIQEVETVRKIIKGALYLRAKKQVKVKQPLQKLEFTIL